MRVAVIGASGYTGLELLRALLRHPRVEVVAATSEQRAGEAIGEAFPALRQQSSLRFESLDPSAIASRAELAFTALPHATSAPVVGALRGAGLRVLDLSADFRLQDVATYESWYGKHPVQERLREAVYGLPELYRETIRKAELVAVPGCYPTAAILSLAPLLRAGLIDSKSIIIDAKSGVSGAGRSLQSEFLFAELDGDCRPYKVAAHRHTPEIEQQLTGQANQAVKVLFTPTLLPTVRGILSSAYARSKRVISSEAATQCLEAAYADEAFVRVLPVGTFPSLRAVRGSNFCDLAAVFDSNTGSLATFAAIDNLLKGASGQAIQCMNLMADFPESMGIDALALGP